MLGGNFALVGAPSVGASGAIFGTVAVTWIDLFSHWKYKYRPGRQVRVFVRSLYCADDSKLLLLVIELIVGVGLGYIPGVDNFGAVMICFGECGKLMIL